MFPEGPHFPPLSDWLSQGHSPIPDPIAREGLEPPSANQPGTGGKGRISSPEAGTFGGGEVLRKVGERAVEAE